MNEEFCVVSALIFFVLFVGQTISISIDNEIIGEPDIECLDDQIRIFIKTRKNFAGRIYAKGKADSPDCAKDDFGSQRTKKPHMDLPFGMCGMKSLRSVDPRGMYYGITLVVSFHTMFITKIDQAFHVKCFFEESSRGLTAELGVSMLAPTELEARHSIPGCSYSIHSSSIESIDSGRPAGSSIQFARVGDKVLHQWHCEDQMFGILINNCYVTDGFGKRADVVDSKGCAIDPILITGIRYSPDLQRAYAESQVFKFADRPGVWFFCQIQMCMKKAGMCEGVTPPACASTGPSVASMGFEEGGGEGLLNAGRRTTKRPKGGVMKNARTRRPTNHDYEPEVSPGGNEEYEEHGPSDGHIEAPRGPTAPSSYGVGGEGFDYDNSAEGASAQGQGRQAIHLPSKSTPEPRPQHPSSAIVTAVFDTQDAYGGKMSAPRPTVLPAATTKHDYSDYEEEVTLPSNLNDLLANLPDDVNADSLQKMFRDSVEDRRALLQGFELLNKEEWNSRRMHDTPEPRGNSGRIRDEREADQSLKVPPTIARQLLIYDLDEEPPFAISDDQGEGEKEQRHAQECAITKNTLFVFASGLAALSALLFIFTLVMYQRLSRTKCYYEEDEMQRYGNVKGSGVAGVKAHSTTHSTAHSAMPSKRAVSPDWR